jgi:hypothetical protein
LRTWEQQPERERGQRRRLSPSREEEEEVDQLQARLPDVLQALVSGYVPDAIDTTNFNQPLPTWETGRVTNTSFMFAGATSFDRVLPARDTGRVTNMSHMFAGATNFDQVLPTIWDTGHVTDMSSMFAGATSFNQALPTTWDTRHINTYRMFAGTRVYV